jgi:hypothetical protein
MRTNDDIIQRLDRESRERTEVVRSLLRDSGKVVALQDFDRRLRENVLGLTGARSAWHSLSIAQRQALQAAGIGNGKLVPGRGFGLLTLRALSQRGLLHCSGPIRDPEAEFVVTERGRFVLRHGQTEGPRYGE